MFRSHSLGQADRDIVAQLHNGLIKDPGELVASQELGSVKKLAKAGDIIISRLRPYLRQVGYVEELSGPAVQLPCATVWDSRCVEPLGNCSPSAVRAWDSPRRCEKTT